MTKKASPDDPKIIRLAPDEEPLDPFGDPSKLVMSQDFAREAGVEKLLTVVPVRKPKPHEFVQVHPNQQFRLTPTAIVDLKDEGEVYFVLPHLAQDLMGEYRMMTLHLAITRQGVVFIWPVPLPDASSGRKQIWAESVNEAAAQAMRAWVRVKWNKALGAYEITKAASWLSLQSGRIGRSAKCSRSRFAAASSTRSTTPWCAACAGSNSLVGPRSSGRGRWADRVACLPWRPSGKRAADVLAPGDVACC